MLHYYIAKKTTAETHRLLVWHAPSITTCNDWFCRFRNGNYDAKDKDHGRPTKEFKDKESEMLLDEDPYQTQTELTALLNVTHQGI